MGEERNMIDRVAFAIMESYGCEDGADGFRACVTDYCSCRQVARQAIEAMREPTWTMIVAGVHHENMGDMAGRWNAMIAAALDPSPIAISEPVAPVFASDGTVLVRHQRSPPAARKSRLAIPSKIQPAPPAFRQRRS